MTLAQTPPAPSAARPRGLRVQAGAAVVYRQFDVGYELDLQQASHLLASSAPERKRPVRSEAQAIRIKNPPVAISLATERVVVGGASCDVEVSARLFDFGVVSIGFAVSAPGEPSWADFTAFGNSVDVGVNWTPIVQKHLVPLLDRIAPAIARPAVAPVSEDYVVFRIRRLLAENGEPLPPGALHDEELVPLLLDERRALSEAARRELLPHRFSYYPDDLAILTWNNALIVEPSPEDADVEYVLEFANAQLLELRYFDAVLDTELRRVYERIAGVRRTLWGRVGRRFPRLLAELQALVADTTDVIERVENSLKVTNDVYLARIYAAALDVFRGRVWRSGVDRKLGILRDTYGMLNALAQASRTELLEVAIVVLIAIDIVVALLLR